MRALHVVRLVERVDGDLPVRGKHRGLVRAEAHLFEVIRAEQAGQRLQVVGQRLGARIEVHEHEPAPAVDPHRRETQVVR